MDKKPARALAHCSSFLLPCWRCGAATACGERGRRVALHQALRRVVAGHLRAVVHDRAHDVRVDALVEADEALVAVDAGRGGAQSETRLGRHHLRLDIHTLV